MSNRVAAVAGIVCGRWPGSTLADALGGSEFRGGFVPYSKETPHRGN
jgi:hypothetical protein